MEHHRVEVEAGVHASVTVHGEGPPLVILGAAAPVAWFEEQLRGLGDRFTVIVYDHVTPGFQGKPAPRTAEAMADHALAVLDAMALDRAHLNGVSGGACVAAYLAARHPERVDKLVLTAPAPPRWSPAIALKREDPAISRFFTDDEWAATLPPDQVLAEWIAAVFSPEFAAANPGQVMAMIHLQDSEVTRAPYLDEPDFEQGPAITADTLILMAENDLASPVYWGRLWAKEIPHATEVVIPGAPHAFLVEQAGAYNQALADFLR